MQLAGWDPNYDPHKLAADYISWDLVAAATPEMSSMIFGTISSLLEV